MQRISYKDIGLKYNLSPFDNPVASVKPGETIILETQDACSGQIQTENDHRDHSKIPFGNPLVGSIYVEGAEKGNTIAVSIADIKPTTGQGCIYRQCPFPAPDKDMQD
jgi:amidase